MTARLGDRSLFSLLEARVYFNHAAISPASQKVIEAASRVAPDYARRGAAAFPDWMEQRERLRTKLAQLVNASEDEIALMPNTTRGVIDTALSIQWKAGDRIVVFDGEFPANVTPWQQAARMFGLEIVMLPADDFRTPVAGPDLSRLAAALAKGVRLVAVSAVEFQTGTRMPLAAMAEMAHACGAELFVDAVQACGATPIDVRGSYIDYLACGSHKWMMGLEGAGFLYVASERLPALRPAVAGWLSHEDGLKFLFEGKGHLRYDRPFKKDARRFEGGNYNTVGLAALEASLDLIQEIGVPAISAHIDSILAPLEAGLVKRGFRSLRTADAARRSSILGVIPPEGRSLIAIWQGLTARGIACSTPDGVLRFSPHWPNHEAQVALVLDAIDDVLKS